MMALVVDGHGLHPKIRDLFAIVLGTLGSYFGLYVGRRPPYEPRELDGILAAELVTFINLLGYGQVHHNRKVNPSRAKEVSNYLEVRGT